MDLQYRSRAYVWGAVALAVMLLACWFGPSVAILMMGDAQ